MMTHAELVDRAAKWLATRAGCGFVLTEYSCTLDECPDAIGWRKSGTSVLVECKASRADFLADLRKAHRATAGLGDWRYYLCEPHTITAADDLPARWGLLHVVGNRIRPVSLVPTTEWQWQTLRSSAGKDERGEIVMLASVVRRVHLRGDLQKVYSRPDPGGGERPERALG
jgi:hypothetical protein